MSGWGNYVAWVCLQRLLAMAAKAALTAGDSMSQTEDLHLSRHLCLWLSGRERQTEQLPERKAEALALA